MTDLTELESSVLTKTLEGDHPILRQMREQVRCCRVRNREFTGVGFFTYFDCRECDPIDDLNARFGDVIAELPGLKNGAGFLLFVENGRIVMLEGYTFEEPWPSDVSTFALRYMSRDGRSWGELGSALS